MAEYRRNILWSERTKFGFYQATDHFFGRQRGFRMFQSSRRKLYKKLHERLKKQEVGELFPVERVSNISLKDFKKKYIAKGKPVIIEGGAKDWGAVENWSHEYFKDLYGDEEVLYVDYENHAKFERLTLGEIIDGIRGKHGKYYRFYPLLQRHPEHINDFDYNWLKACRHKINWNENFNVFIGGEGSSSPLHNSFSNNIFIQISGEKEWVIYPPYYSVIFDPDPAMNMYRGVSERQGDRFDPFNPDYEKHPLFKYIDGYKVTLKPGDILYNPPYWWHAVRNPSDSIGVGYRWFPPLHCLRKAPLYFSLDLMVRKPPIWKALKLANKDINLVQLASTGKLDEYYKELNK